MAVTKIWTVTDSISRVIDYCNDPVKTKFTDLEHVIKYASNEEKVSIKRADLTKYFPSSYTPEQIIKSILGILETQRQREQQEIQRKERKRDDGAR